jgi:hypothetical protein
MSGAPTSVTTRKERIASLDKAIKRGGGIVAFSRRMGVTHQAVYRWRNRGWVPLERAITIDAIQHRARWADRTAARMGACHAPRQHHPGGRT